MKCFLMTTTDIWQPSRNAILGVHSGDNAKQLITIPDLDSMRSTHSRENDFEIPSIPDLDLNDPIDAAERSFAIPSIPDLDAIHGLCNCLDRSNRVERNLSFQRSFFAAKVQEQLCHEGTAPATRSKLQQLEFCCKKSLRRTKSIRPVKTSEPQRRGEFVSSRFVVDTKKPEPKLFQRNASFTSESLEMTEGKLYHGRENEQRNNDRKVNLRSRHCFAGTRESQQQQHPRKQHLRRTKSMRSKFTTKGESERKRKYDRRVSVKRNASVGANLLSVRSSEPIQNDDKTGSFRRRSDFIQKSNSSTTEILEMREATPKRHNLSRRLHTV